MLSTDLLLTISRDRGWTVFGPRDPIIHGLGTDSREDLTEKVFLALSGERFDGHDYIEKAVDAGAVGLIVHRLRAPTIARQLPGHLVIGVEDCLHSLGEIAKGCRDHDQRPVVAITGSAGKTSTRLSLTSAAQAAGFTVHASPGNENNRIGLPRFLINIPAPVSDCPAPGELIVLEAGTSEPGEIARLGAISSPDVAVVVSVSAAHTELLIDEEGVAHEKGDLLRAPGPGEAWAIADADPRLIQAATEGGRRLIIPASDRLVGGVWADAAPHHKDNAAKVLAVFEALNVSVTVDVVQAAFVEPAAGRGGLQQVGGLTVMDDSYNANPASMTAAFAAAIGQAGDRPLVFCLGEMRELGPASHELHRAVASEAAAAGAVQLFLAGPYGEDGAAAARRKGCPEVYIGADGADVLDELHRIPAGAFVLVKGSRGARMERIIQALQAQAGAP